MKDLTSQLRRADNCCLPGWGRDKPMVNEPDRHDCVTQPMTLPHQSYHHHCAPMNSCHGMAVRHPKGVTTERFFILKKQIWLSPPKRGCDSLIILINDLTEKYLTKSVLGSLRSESRLSICVISGARWWRDRRRRQPERIQVDPRRDEHYVRPYRRLRSIPFDAR
ncbi:hypothetical protein T265_02424 [Opisthorchis viverrini]|uniref:Uncharacterized protein n=1 Tax=Opisthorchis viverrini TaxID=6198 RepID=A0A075AIC2_OPIVI|nr:hypothetical protein T265_02424 [Opisthorchis viverrini]KER31379.1 hypothetical protein T265_02424 [Opisthorchis viverrini]